MASITLPYNTSASYWWLVPFTAFAVGAYYRLSCSWCPLMIALIAFNFLYHLNFHFLASFCNSISNFL
jgi:hypothetical protein